MARSRKLNPQAVRTIFKSKDPAAAVAKQFKVSQNLVYLIRARRVHARITDRLKAPEMPRRRRGPRAANQPMKLDVNRLAAAIVRQLMRQLRDGLRRRRGTRAEA